MKTLIEIMARSVGARPQQNKNCDVEYLMDVEALERLVELARADEREACAKVCDELIAPDVYSDTDVSMWDVTCIDCASAIRARSNTC
jgi:hypothetical protein